MWLLFLGNRLSKAFTVLSPFLYKICPKAAVNTKYLYLSDKNECAFSVLTSVLSSSQMCFLNLVPVRSSIFSFLGK